MSGFLLHLTTLCNFAFFVEKKEMKQLLIAALMLVTFAAQAQRNVVIKENYALTSADTTFYVTTSDSYTWGMLIKWSGVAGGTNAVFTVRVSRDKVNWTDYSGPLTYTMTAAAGLIGFEDDRSAYPYIGIRIQRGTASGGDIDIYLTVDANQ